MHKKRNIGFSDLLAFFPEVELPLTITEESQSAFARKNKPFSEAVTLQFLEPLHPGQESDPYTEYVPCLRLTNTNDFHALIYWKAGLAGQEYFLWTTDKKGNTIDHQRIAGTFWDGDTLLRMVASIDADWIIYVVLGSSDRQDQDFHPEESAGYNLELLANGKIIHS